MATLQFSPPFLWSAGILWPTACTAVVAARFVTRKVQRVRFGWDDWLTIPAVVLIDALSALMIVGVAEKAMGYPTPVTGSNYTATSREQTITRKIYWVYQILHPPAIAFIKLSCLAFYARVFRTGLKGKTDVFLTIFAVAVVAWGIAFTVASLFACGTLKHLDYLWTNLENQEKCTVNQPAWLKSMAVTDMAMDVFLLAFPMPYIMQLRLPLKRKIGIVVIFLFGLLSLACSTIRVAELFETLSVEFHAKTDEDGQSTNTAYFMLLEAGSAMIAICLPCLASAWHFEGVQTFFANISRTFSISSRSTQTEVVLTNVKNDGRRDDRRFSESW